MLYGLPPPWILSPKINTEQIYAGQTISHYKTLEKLGAGGMGVVYKALDTRLDRFVALKFLPQHLSEDEMEKQRFIHEAKAASALDHPNICTIYEINKTDDGQMFIAMAYYEGKTLREKIARGPLSVDNAIEIVTQIASGLAKAHAHGITHSIWKMPVKGDEESLVLDVSVEFGSVAFVREGFYYFDDKTGPASIKFFDFATQNTTTVTVLNDPLALLGLSASLDRRWLLYSQRHFEGDIMLVENFR